MRANELTNDAITADFRILQRRGGHRYSLDDLATAWEACRAQPRAERYLDLGCGIGSVLLMVSWKLPQVRGWGIEAQAESAAIARRNLALNRLEDRAELLEGDLRRLTDPWPHAPCDLITGTPPYLPVGTALASPDPQRAAARLELRGGIEDYLAAAARALSDDGMVVVCADGRRPERVLGGAEAAGLVPARRRDVLARADARAPLFAVWTLSRWATHFEHSSLLMREKDGRRTPEAYELRRFFGLGEPSRR